MRCWLDCPPFYSKNVNLMYELISKVSLRIPSFLSPNAKDLMEKLLKRNPEERLGAGPEDEDQIRAHAFFSDLDFDLLYQRKITPEFKPRIKGMLDSSNFDTEFTDEPVVDSVAVASHKPRDPAESDFSGFSFAPESTGKN